MKPCPLESRSTSTSFETPTSRAPTAARTLLALALTLQSEQVRKRRLQAWLAQLAWGSTARALHMWQGAAASSSSSRSLSAKEHGMHKGGVAS